MPENETPKPEPVSIPKPTCDGCGNEFKMEDLVHDPDSPRSLCARCMEKRPKRKPYVKPAVIASVSLDDLGD